MHLHITLLKVPRKYLIVILDNKLYQRSFAVSAFASVRAGYVEMIAGQFQRKGQKISWHRIHPQNLRDSRRRFGSAHQNTQLFDGFFTRTELLAFAGVESLVLLGQKRD